MSVIDKGKQIERFMMGDGTMHFYHAEVLYRVYVIGLYELCILGLWSYIFGVNGIM